MKIYPLRLFVLCLITAFSFTSRVQAETSTLVLKARQVVAWEKQRSKQVAGRLVRELARQSLLIAARDELGILTLDQTLREDGLGDESELTLLLTVDPELDDECDVKITLVDGKESKEVWFRPVKYDASPTNTYITLIPKLEAFSRGEFVELLKELGVEKAAQQKEKISDSAQSEELQEIDQLLQEVDLLSQFLAVRRLHKLMRNVGESPETLGLLVNGYANLGLLTECTLSSDSRAFMARSMIYAQRLREKYGNYLYSRWHWSYAQAIAGIHFTALKQMKDPIPEQEEGVLLPTLPGWGELVEPYCRYDTEALQVLAENGNRWARYLQLWSLFTAGEARQLNQSAETILGDCPEAFNAYTLLGLKCSIGITHQVRPASIRAMMQTCALRIFESDDLPEAVRQAALTPPTQKSPLEAWGKVIETLRQEEDASELSWGMLANLLEDTAAMVAAANLQMARSGSQEHSMAPYVDLFWPAIKDYSYANYFDSRRYRGKNDQEEIRRICQELRFVDPSQWIEYEAYYVWGTMNSRGERIGYNAFYASSRDFTATSLVLANQRQGTVEKWQKMYASELRRVSPRSPLALVYEIRLLSKKEDTVKPKKIRKWKKLAGSSAKVWHELGQFYLARQEYEESYEELSRWYH